MVRIRLARHGRKSRPFYHIVASDSRFPRDGRFLEKLGHYDPHHEPSQYTFNLDRLQYWYGVGAQLSPPVKVLLRKKGIVLERAKTHAEAVTTAG